MFIAAERRGLPTLTRVGEKSDPGLILKYLDAGSDGILLPQAR